MFGDGLDLYSLGFDDVFTVFHLSKMELCNVSGANSAWLYSQHRGGGGRKMWSWRLSLATL